MFHLAASLTCTSLALMKLCQFLAKFGDPDFFVSMLSSTPFHLQPSVNTMLALSAFIIISIFTIALVSSFIPVRPNSPNYCPASVTAPDDINTFYYFPTTIKATSKPVVNSTAHQVLSPPSVDQASQMHNSSPSTLKESFSLVTFTFGTDRPEVYLKMCEPKKRKIICHCPCNHKSPELQSIPHINNITSSCTPTTPSSGSNSTFEVDSEELNPFEFTTANAGSTPAPSYHAVDMAYLPDIQSLEQVVCDPGIEPEVCDTSYPPLLEVCVENPPPLRRVTTQMSIIPNDQIVMAEELKKVIVSQFKMFELVVAFAAFMRTLVGHAANQTNVRRVPN